MENNEQEEVIYVPLDALVPYTNDTFVDACRVNPYPVEYDDDMKELIDSIKTDGLINPLVARPLDNGKYQILSGHRRAFACKVIMDKVPVVIKDLDDAAAAIYVVDSNLHRENIPPLVKASALYLRQEARKHQGARTDLTSDQNGPKLPVAKRPSARGESKTQTNRLIRLNNLNDGFKQKLTDNKIGVTSATEVALLSHAEQDMVLDAMEREQVSPSVSQAIKLIKESKANGLTEESVAKILTSPKPKSLVIPLDLIQPYFPRDFPLERMQDAIVDMLKHEWERQQQQKRRQRSR